nr:MFS transporter [uncultured Roseateles sp.]
MKLHILSPFDQPDQRAGAILVTCAAASVFLAMPVVLGALADLRGLPPDQLGQIASAETFGIAITATFSPVLMRRFGIRPLMLLGMALLALSNLGTCLVSSYGALIAMRLLTSVAAGLAMPAAVAFLGRSSEPERLFSWLVGMQTVQGSLELFGFPVIARQAGVEGIYAALAALAALAGLWALRCRPTPPPPDAPGAGRLTAAPRAALLAVMMFFSCIGIYWAFIERVGVTAQLTPEQVGGWLAASNLPALLAALIAPWVSGRLGERRTLLLGLGLAIVVPLGLLLPLSAAAYLVNLTLFVVAWNALMVVQMAQLGHWDLAGLAVSLTPAAQSFGLALAPLAAGELAERSGYPAAMAAASACALLALLATLHAYRMKAREPVK